MSEKLAEYWSNVCLGYALVLFGTSVLGYLSEKGAGGLGPVVTAGVVMLLLVGLGAWFARRSARSVAEHSKKGL